MAKRAQILHSINSRCKVIIWHFKDNQEITKDNEDDLNYEGTTYTFSNESSGSSQADNPVTSVMYRKSMSNSPGEFKVTFAPSTNILKKACPGDWIAIYLTQGSNDSKSASAPVSAYETVTPVTYTQSLDGTDRQKTYYWTPSQRKLFEDRQKERFPSKNDNIAAAFQAGRSNGYLFINDADAFDQLIQSGGLNAPPISVEPDNLDGWSLRCLGNINRSARSENINALGTRITQYVVSGFDFTKVFFDTTIYLNQWIGEDFKYQKLMQDVFKPTKDGMKQLPQGWIEGFVNFFLGPGVKTPITRLTQQWHIPKPMAQYFGAGGTSGPLFYNILQQNYLNQIDGARIDWLFPPLTTLWQMMLTHSHPAINELFCEIDNGRPALTLRMHPYAFKKYTDPKKQISDISYFMDLAQVEVPLDYIMNLNIGLSDHDRKNLFFLIAAGDGQNNHELSAVSLQSEDLIVEGSLKRYGTRIDVGESRFLTFSTKKGPNYKLLHAVNLLRKHWFKNNQCLLNGSLTMIGNPDIRIGKRLKIPSTESTGGFDQHYYVVQYTDQWEYPGVWTQTVALDRGIFIKNGSETYSCDVETDDYSSTGLTVIKGMKR